MLDYSGIFREFNKNKIEYLICGGLAVNLYGIPRLTYDIDLLLNMKAQNLEKFCKLLKKWGFKPRVPVDIMDFSKKSKRDEWIKQKNLKAFIFVNPDWALSEIDIIIDSTVNYSAAIRNAKIFKSSGITLPVVSLKDLIKMKRNTGRKQDTMDIKNLLRVMDEER